MSLSTHVLDTTLGRPAAGVPLLLELLRGAVLVHVGEGVTDIDGRCRTLLGEATLEAATYRLRFETGPYFSAQGVRSLYPYVEIVFQVSEPERHHHIPLLIAANGYTTYRGS